MHSGCNPPLGNRLFGSGFAAKADRTRQGVRSPRGARGDSVAVLRPGIALAAVLLVLGCGAQAPRPVPADPDRSPRLVSLSPNLTEILFALGAEATLAGRSSACDYPPEAVRSIPVAGGFGAPDIETLLALQPTVVVSTDLLDKRLPQRLAAHGIRYVQVPCKTIEDILEGILVLGALSAHSPQADALHRTLHEAIAALRAAAPSVENRPRVYIEIWHHPPTSCGGGSFVSQLVELAGGRNLAESIRQDYFTLDREWILARDPDLILCAYMTPDRSTSTRSLLTSRPGWDSLRAVRAGRVYSLPDPDPLLRPGPRLLEAIAQVQAILAADRAME